MASAQHWPVEPGLAFAGVIESSNQRVYYFHPHPSVEKQTDVSEAKFYCIRSSIQ